MRLFSILCKILHLTFVFFPFFPFKKYQESLCFISFYTVVCFTFYKKKNLSLLFTGVLLRKRRFKVAVIESSAKFTS